MKFSLWAIRFVTSRPGGVLTYSPKFDNYLTVPLNQGGLTVLSASLALDGEYLGDSLVMTIACWSILVKLFLDRVRVVKS